MRDLAGKVLNAAASNRASVVEQYRPALALKGDATRGLEVYQKLCIVCHKRGNLGNDIGPDLRSVVEHPPEKMLVNILDPSSDVQPGFHAYTCTLTNGEELYGIITAETGNSLVMKFADGKSRTVLRSEIAALRSSNLSLMPDGLETGLSHQNLADLIQLLRSPLEPK